MSLKSTQNKGLEGQLDPIIDRSRLLNPSCGSIAAVALVICLIFGLFAHTTERTTYRHYLQEVRAVVFQEAALIASRLEAEVNSSFFLVSGLASYIGFEDDITQEEYAEICARMFDAIPGLVNIAAAPDLVNRFVYPLEGNEAVLNMSYEDLPEQIDAIRQIEKTKQPIIAGPVELVQGGEAIIGRFPVFTTNGRFEAEDFWGIISTPIRVESIYEQADLPLDSSNLEIALRGKDGLGANGAVFLGDRDLFYSGAVLYPVPFFHGSWEMAIAPKDGWPQHAPSRGLIYVVCAVLCLLTVLLLISLCLYLKRANEAREIEQSVQLVKERFYSNMSHEIRTPLNAILGLSELVGETTEESFTKESVSTISKSAHALTELISDVLFLSEDAINQGPPPSESFNANDLLDEVIAPMVPEIEKKKLKLRVEKIPGEDAEIYSSKQYLRQILWHLVLNAVKFTNEGTITFRLYRKNHELCFQCTDTGVGIDEAFQSQLFETFTQEDTSPSRHFEGAGVGLAIVKRSVQILNGTIAFESEKSVGTTFWVKVPLAESRELDDRKG
ncbi:hypothetical protein DDZ13_13955 [Coraliomargarita sinensis]|uniref:histidine kinase n=1 Tax=Coraliomargarita sinensis TaxID=2174842 RepID=A0A317ZI32_9BACT|nr:ATP-binding protein [Coraliomargarita sinensis]PXA03021.1 hypothetical protein DDZ13_13955 [Coraliomargarita sinensis]